MTHVRLAPVVLASVCLVTPAHAGQQPQPASSAHPAKPTHSTQGPVHHTLVPVAQRITNNPALVTRLQPLLPPGMTLASAADGFRNEGQFIAALHVSKNLNIPFAQLKAEMTGTDHDSLGRAIHELQPNIDAKAAAKTAEQEARTDVQATKPPPHKGNDNQSEQK